MPASSFLVSVAVIALAVLSAACRQDMHNQPKYKPLRPSAFFADNRSSRPTIEGAVARGQLREDTHLYTGKLGSGQQGSQPGGASGSQPTVATGDEQQAGLVAQGAASSQGAASQSGNASSQAMPGVNTQPGQQAATQSYQGYVTTFPFAIDEAAINRGQERFNIYCSV
ncbi:MAG TPA: hypothetical protein VF747_16720, partial [Blastocatellia bacterium]